MVNCQCCGKNSDRLLTEQASHFWKQCSYCEFVYLDPMPADDAPSLCESQQQHGHGYIRAYRGRKLISKYYRSIGRALLLRQYMPGNRMLDVGSNVGIMVAAARWLGIDAEGLEINPDLVVVSRQRVPKASFYCGTIETASFASESFDGVYCSEVIEHVPTPSRFIDEIWRILRQNGVIFLTTPSIHEYHQQDSGWHDLGAPDHKVYFSHQNISEFLDRHGFDLLYRHGGTSKGIKVIARRRSCRAR